MLNLLSSGIDVCDGERGNIDIFFFCCCCCCSVLCLLIPPLSISFLGYTFGSPSQALDVSTFLEVEDESCYRERPSADDCSVLGKMKHWARRRARWISQTVLSSLSEKGYSLPLSDLGYGEFDSFSSGSTSSSDPSFRPCFETSHVDPSYDHYTVSHLSHGSSTRVGKKVYSHYSIDMSEIPICKRHRCFHRVFPMRFIVR